MSDVDESAMTANLNYLDEHTLKPGDTNSGLLDYAHQTINTYSPDKQLKEAYEHSSGFNFFFAIITC